MWPHCSWEPEVAHGRERRHRQRRLNLYSIGGEAEQPCCVFDPVAEKVEVTFADAT